MAEGASSFSGIAGIVGGAFQGAGTLMQMRRGNEQRRGGKRDLKRLLGENHDFQIESEYNNNKDLASYMAQNGLGEQALNFYKTQNERMLSRANQVALDVGGGINAIQGNLDSSIRGLAELTVKDGMMKNDNLKLLMEQNTALAAQKTMKWAIGYKKWMDDIARARNDVDQGSQNLVKGMTNFGQTWSNLGGASGNLDTDTAANSNSDPQQTQPAATNSQQSGGGMMGGLGSMFGQGGQGGGMMGGLGSMFGQGGQSSGNYTGDEIDYTE